MIGSLPTMMFQLSWARPSYFIPACELVWSALVMGMAGAKDIKTVTIYLLLLQRTDMDTKIP
jgi:ACS family pantothenate transporter-like MFS transporter